MTPKQNSLSLSEITSYQPRQFLSETANLTQKETAVMYYQQLLDTSLQTPEQLETLLLNRSELEAAIAQQQSILYIQMTCQTDDPVHAQAYKSFIETVVPAIKPLDDQLDRKIMQAVDELGVDESCYDVYFQAIRTDIEIFRESNIPLQTEDALLSQEYQTLTGAMTVHFQGSEHTMPQMRKFTLDADRDTREQAWRLTAQRYLQDAGKLDEIFDKMMSLRQTIAQNAGFENYRDYAFTAKHRFDYTPNDCKAYHQAVETYLVPVSEQMMGRRAEQLGLKKLRPWDLSTDPLSRPPLKPFETAEEFIERMEQVFCKVDTQFGRWFALMKDNGLLDLVSRKGKAPGGYQASLSEIRKPFIFMNAVGTNDDLRVLMHEGGHAFHTFLCADQKLFSYRHAPYEFCEVASMSMEMLSASQLTNFYDAPDLNRWWREQLETIIRILVSVAVNDSFQHWLYENPSHTAKQRHDQWMAISKRFGGEWVDWTGLEAERSALWQRIPHLYQTPFYYIEYGIAQLGALGLWLQSKQDMAQAIANYKNALSLGGSKPLPELFAAAGLPFDFSEKTVRPLSEMLLKAWATYSAE